MVMPALDVPAPRTAPAGPQGPSRPATTAGPRRRRRFRPRWFVVALVLLLLLPVGMLLFADQKLDRHEVWPTAARPAATPGADWLIVGSDSREGLSKEERKKLATGNAYGKRTDTMMLLHIPAGGLMGGGSPTLVSLPRDSYVPIPGHGQNKLNAAYAFGGPKLLIQTVENLTQIRIDHYAEIGFDGLFDLVNTLGGVEMCPKAAANDPKAGLNIKAGCQEFNGQDALGYARSRALTRGDLDRVGHQRELITAIVAKAASPTTLLNPLKAWGLATKGPSSLAVAEGDHITDLAKLAWAGRSLSDGVTTTVPIGAETRNASGWVVTWHPTRSKALFDALRADKPVPATAVSA
jgi:LCP family protein required for cell wall assembly